VLLSTRASEDTLKSTIETMGTPPVTAHRMRYVPASAGEWGEMKWAGPYSTTSTAYETAVSYDHDLWEANPTGLRVRLYLRTTGAAIAYARVSYNDVVIGEWSTTSTTFVVFATPIVPYNLVSAFVRKRGWDIVRVEIKTSDPAVAAEVKDIFFDWGHATAPQFAVDREGHPLAGLQFVEVDRADCAGFDFYLAAGASTDIEYSAIPSRLRAVGLSTVVAGTTKVGMRPWTYRSDGVTRVVYAYPYSETVELLGDPGNPFWTPIEMIHYNVAFRGGEPTTDRPTGVWNFMPPLAARYGFGVWFYNADTVERRFYGGVLFEEQDRSPSPRPKWAREQEVKQVDMAEFDSSKLWKVVAPKLPELKALGLVQWGDGFTALWVEPYTRGNFALAKRTLEGLGI